MLQSLSYVRWKNKLKYEKDNRYRNTLNLFKFFQESCNHVQDNDHNKHIYLNIEIRMTE